jgi:hypothetical protein
MKHLALLEPLCMVYARSIFVARTLHGQTILQRVCSGHGRDRRAIMRDVNRPPQIPSEHRMQRAVIAWALLTANRFPQLRLLHAILNAGERSFAMAKYLQADRRHSGRVTRYSERANVHRIGNDKRTRLP